jgi:hypothetical protein
MPQGHRELERRERGDEEERARPAAAPPPAHELLALQAAAGNRAVARAVLQRDATVAAPGAPVMLPGLNTPLDPSIMAGLDKRQKEVEKIVRGWLEEHRGEVQGQISVGASLPELIDLVRTSVKEATELGPETVGKIVTSAMAPLTIAPHRLQQRDKELTAELRNALGKLPEELKVGGAGAWAKVSISGLEAGTKLGGAQVTGQAGPGSATGTVKKGGTEAELEVDWDEKTIALDTKVGPIGLGGKIGMGKGGSPDTWEIHLGVPRAGALGPLLPSTQKAVRDAGDAVSGIINHLRSGGRADDPVIERYKKTIKDGLEPVGKMAVENAVTWGISVTGDGPDVRVEGSFTWRF